jgi:hypothetical protein
VCAGRSGEAPTWKLEAAGTGMTCLSVKSVTSQQLHHRLVETATHRPSQQIRRRPGAAKTPERMGRYAADGVNRWLPTRRCDRCREAETQRLGEIIAPMVLKRKERGPEHAVVLTPHHR